MPEGHSRREWCNRQSEFTYLDALTKARKPRKGTSTAARRADWLETHRVELLKTDRDLGETAEPYDPDAFFALPAEKDPYGPKHGEDLPTPLCAVRLLLGDTWRKMYEATLEELEETITKKKKKNPDFEPKVKPKNLTLAVFYKFIACLLILGISGKRKIEQAWQKTSVQFCPHLPKILGRDRFFAILGAFTRSCDSQRYFYVFWNGMKHPCQTLWELAQGIGVDETLLHFVGWFRHHAYMMRKKAKQGIKFFGAYDTAGWIFDWHLSKRKTLDGKRLERVKIENLLAGLLPPTTNKTRHLFTDSFSTKEALVESLALQTSPSGDRYWKFSGSCSIKRMPELWRLLDADLDCKRETDKSHTFSAATGVLPLSGERFWAVSVISGRKKDANAKHGNHLHYISTFVDSQRHVTAMKTDHVGDGRKVKRARALSAVKHVYDGGYDMEDQGDQRAAESLPVWRFKSFEAKAIVGIMNLVATNNGALLYLYANPDEPVMTAAEFMTSVAFGLAAYDPAASHTFVEEDKRGCCACCAWWKANRNTARSVNMCETRCAACRVRVCSDCMRYRHARYVVETGK